MLKLNKGKQMTLYQAVIFVIRETMQDRCWFIFRHYFEKADDKKKGRRDLYRRRNKSHEFSLETLVLNNCGENERNFGNAKYFTTTTKTTADWNPSMRSFCKSDINSHSQVCLTQQRLCWGYQGLSSCRTLGRGSSCQKIFRVEIQNGFYTKMQARKTTTTTTFLLMTH